MISSLIISYLFTEFTMKFWESKHNMRIPATTVNPLISQKLLTEHSSVKKALNDDGSALDEQNEYQNKKCRVLIPFAACRRRDGVPLQAAI